MKYQILQGDNRTTLKSLPDNSIDAIVTDPPYGIDFLGKSWDANTGALETYQECLRVLKPGGHILAFSAARTYHHLAVTLEQAGFEIRDQIMWIYSSGFPKSQDIGKSIQRSLGVKEKKTIKGGARPSDMMVHAYAEENEYTQPVLTDPEAKAWAGWGTQLKPAHEPIALARKPIKLSIARNCQVHGVGALNIDATRISIEGLDTRSGGSDGWDRVEFGEAEPNKYSGDGYVPNEQGRFPSNVLGEILQADYQKYFYCPKVSRRERHIGHETPPAMFGDSKGAYDENGERYAVGLDARAVIDRKDMVAAMGGKWVNDAGEHLDAWTSDANAKSVWLPGKGDIRVHGLTHEYAEWCKANGKDPGNVGNNHPTVKPIELMKYLIRLITPPGGVVLDPFNGSGSTGCAAVELDHEYIGCELDPAYVEIACRRIEAWYAEANPTTFNRLFEPGLAQVAK
jgi:site-specific DNA-methyltransferase (adenine-specific)